MQQRLLGARKWNWRAGEILEVQVCDSNLEVNGQELQHLVITTRSGRSTFWLGWPKAELETLAAEIVRALPR